MSGNFPRDCPDWYSTSNLISAACQTEKDYLMTDVNDPPHEIKAFAGDRKTVGTVLIFLTLTLFVFAMIMPYYKSPEKYSLISDASTVALNAPMFLLLLCSVITSFFRRTQTSSIFTLFPVLVFTLTGSITWIGDWITGTSIPGPGAFADLFVLIIGFLGIWRLWDRTEINFEVRRDSLRWAFLGVSIILLFQIGSFMNWTKTTLRITNGTNIWKDSNSKTWVKQCCIPFQNSSGPENVRTGLGILFSLLLVFGFVFIIPRFLSGVAVLSLGIILLSTPFSWLVDIAKSSPDPATLGYSSGDITQNGIVVNVSGLLGGWIALGASIMLIIQGIFMCLSSMASHSKLHDDN